MTSEAGMSDGILQALAGNVKREAAVQYRDEAERLRAAVAFLVAAEKGKADVSDIEQIAAESFRKYAEAKRQRQEQLNSSRATLEAVMKKLTGSFKQVKKGAED